MIVSAYGYKPHLRMTLVWNRQRVRSPVLESKIWEPSDEELVIIKSGMGSLDWVKKGVTLLKTFPLPTALIYDDTEKYLRNVSNPDSDSSHTRSLLASGMHVIRISHHCDFQKEFLETAMEVLQGEENPIMCVSDTSVYEYLVRCL